MARALFLPADMKLFCVLACRTTGPFGGGVDAFYVPVGALRLRGFVRHVGVATIVPIIE